MFRVILLLAGLIMVTVAPAAEPAISPSSPLFLQGQADRQAWEAWFNAQAGEFRAGAEYWVTHRSDAKPVSCAAIARSMSVQWAAGCRAAADRLAGPDRRRKSEREYRAGWNSPGPLSPSAATPAPPLAARSVTGAGYPFGQTIVQDSVSDRQGGVLDRQYSAPARQDSGNLSPPIVLVALIAIVGACIMMRRRAKAAEQQRRIDRACYYFRSVDQARAFPSVPVNVNLQPGEVGLLQSPASLSEMRTHHYNTGVRVRIANGFWLGGSQSHSYRAREIVDRGMVAITTRRIPMSAPR
jgi:hypothetical protein